MHFSHVISLLVIKFGPRAVTLAGDLVREHLTWLLIALGLAIIFGVAFWWYFKKKRAL